MNPDVKARWVAALRSDEYKQGGGYLAKEVNDETLYCCLGVLSELAAQAGVCEAVLNNGVIQYDGFRGYLPDSVVTWAGLSNESPMIPTDAVRDRLPKGQGEWPETSLAFLNDKGEPFDRIADLIDAHL